MKTFKLAGTFLLAGAIALAGCQGSKGPAGQNGQPGQNGNTCTVVDNHDGTGTISCTDGTSATVANGTNGTNGTSCSVADNGNGTVTVTCTDGTTATVSSGTNGQSCAVADNGNGTRTITCADGSHVTVADAVVSYALMSDAEKADANMSAVITSATVPADGKPVVTLKVSDRKGNGVKGLSPDAAVAGISWRFAILKLAAGVNGSAADTWVSYLAANDHSSASTETAVVTATASAGAIVDNGDGTYTFTFAKNITAGPTAAGTTYDAAAVHRVVVLMSKSGNPFAPINLTKDFIPATGADTAPNANEKVDGAACLECHTRFRAVAGGTGAFHSGQRYDVKVCVACHNDQRRFTSAGANVTEPADIAADTTLGAKWTGSASLLNGEAIINLPVFIHKIHMGEDLTLKGGNYAAVPQPYEVTYPQDVRNCAKCHRNVPKADNWKTPSRRACGACHDAVDFAGTALPGRTVSHDIELDDSDCLICHGAGKGLEVAKKHVAVALPDPNSTFAGGSNSNTNAAYVAAANSWPTGAVKITYQIGTVTRDATKHPQISFKLRRQDSPTATAADVVFNPFGGSTELIDNFVGGPSVYFVFSVPQDGVAAPADWNASASAYIKGVWNGTNTNATMTGPDATGFYTITINNVVVPDNAVNLTGGVGYTYSLPASQPLTQTNVTGYAYNTTSKVGGLIMPAPDASKVATAGANVPTTMATTRRAIVSNAKCNGCHEFLGVAPTFHAGQRNDAPTCAFCHNPNRTSSGWSANAKDFVHGIHAAGFRNQDFTWHASTNPDGVTGSGFWSITFPAILNNCESCHVAGSYDFSASASKAAVPNLLPSTVATGTLTAPATGFNANSPYVVLGNNYGAGFAFAGATGTSTDAASSTLVISPITAACAACHDSTTAIDHMQGNGGSFYSARSSALATPEQCLICHGPGKVAAIADVHK